MAKRRPLPKGVYETLRLLGAPEHIEPIGYRMPFAFIGVRGASVGSAMLALDKTKVRGRLVGAGGEIVCRSSCGSRRASCAARTVSSSRTRWRAASAVSWASVTNVLGHRAHGHHGAHPRRGHAENRERRARGRRVKEQKTKLVCNIDDIDRNHDLRGNHDIETYRALELLAASLCPCKPNYNKRGALRGQAPPPSSRS